MIRITKAAFIDKEKLSAVPVWQIVRKQFLTTCPHCAQNIYIFEDAITDTIKMNELCGHHIPISGLRKPFPHNLRLQSNLLNCYRNDGHMFYKERHSPYGYICFYTREDAENFLKTIIIPEKLPFDPSLFRNTDEAKKRKEDTVNKIAAEQYVIIPVFPTDNSEYCVSARLHVPDYNKKTIPEFELVVLSDIYVTIEVEKYIK